jgi:phosphoribosylformylglycinamidine cyclo-ligase
MKEVSASAYAAAGVDLNAAAGVKLRIANIAEASYTGGTLSTPGGFGGVFDVDTRSEYLIVSSTDSVGTKLKIAQVMGKHDTIGIDIVNHCVNDILPAGAEPLFFLDYIGISGYDSDLISEIVSGVATGCVENGCALIGGETASLPGIYQGEDYDLVGFIVGRVKRDALLDPGATEVGDVLLALPSSGLHTNGYSLVRSVFDTDRDSSAVNDVVPLDGRTLGEALLAPHRSYLQDLRPILGNVKSLAHITGGSFVKNVPRALAEGIGARLSLGSWSPPPLFDYIQQQGGIDKTEMYNVFNMGVGMIICAAPQNVESLLSQLSDAWIIGETTKHDGSEDRVAFV